jgi:hypothetical protein
MAKKEVISKYFNKYELQKTINVLAYPRHGIPSDPVVQLKKEVSK